MRLRLNLVAGLAALCAVAVVQSASAQEPAAEETAASTTPGSAPAPENSPPAEADAQPAPAAEPADSTPPPDVAQAQAGTPPASAAAEPAAAEPAVVATIPVATHDEPEPEPTRDSDGHATRLEDVVVTATKREESVRKLAQTVNTLSGEVLEQMGAREMSDYLRYVPGITMQEGDTNLNRSISIRGIGPQPGGNPTTGVLIENVSTGDPYQSYLVPDLDPFDLHDLEVLKGPQGTLFGAAALNGAIRYVLNKPELGNWSARGFASYGRVTQGGHAPTYGGLLNMPVGESAALRGVYVKQELPGLYDDINVNKHVVDADFGNKSMLRVLGRWQAAERLSFNAFYLKQDGHRDDLSIANNWDGEYTRTDTPGHSTSQQKFTVANLDARYSFDFATAIAELSRSTKKQKVFYDGSAILEPLAQRGIETLGLYNLAESTSDAYEVRLVSPDGDSPWKWIAGLYLNKYQVNASLNTPVANTQFLSSLLGALGVLNLPDNPISQLTPTPDGLSVEYIKFEPITAEEKAVFGEITRKFFDGRLSVNLGGRYYKEDLDANVIVQGALAAVAPILGYSGGKALKAKGFNPKGSVTFQWTPSIMHYVTVARGFQFGGLNAPAPIPTDNVYPLTYKPSTIWSYETGLRIDWLEKTLQTDLTYFFVDWTDMQLRQDTPSGNTDYTANISRARSTGLEGSLRWLTPIPGLMLASSGSYIRATVQEPYTTVDGSFIAKGADLPASPHLQSATTLAYNTQLWSYSAGANVGYTYMGPAFSNVQHDEVIFDYGMFDAGVTLGAPQWASAPELNFGVTNITDKHAFVGKRGTNVAGIPQAKLGAYTRPRSFLLRLSVSF